MNGPCGRRRLGFWHRRGLENCRTRTRGMGRYSHRRGSQIYGRMEEGRGECGLNPAEEERGGGGRQGCRRIGGDRRTVETFQGSAAWTVSSTTEATTAAPGRDAEDPTFGMKMSDVLTCNVFFPWVRMPISSVHFLCLHMCLQRVVSWLCVQYAFEQCCPCFLHSCSFSFF